MLDPVRSPEGESYPHAQVCPPGEALEWQFWEGPEWVPSPAPPGCRHSVSLWTPTPPWAGPSLPARTRTSTGQKWGMWVVAVPLQLLSRCCCVDRGWAGAQDLPFTLKQLCPVSPKPKSLVAQQQPLLSAHCFPPSRLLKGKFSADRWLLFVSFIIGYSLLVSSACVRRECFPGNSRLRHRKVWYGVYSMAGISPTGGSLTSGCSRYTFSVKAWREVIMLHCLACVPPPGPYGMLSQVRKCVTRFR